MNITFKYETERQKVMRMMMLDDKLDYIEELYQKTRNMLKHGDCSDVCKVVELLEDIKLTMSHIFFSGE